MTEDSDTDRGGEDRPVILDSLTHQRSARNDPSMRDGDSGRGNPYESGDDPDSTDADVGDAGVEIDTADAEVVREGVPISADDLAPEGPAGPPIDGYQNLTVPQVVERLATLSPDEVRAVREYEAAHRNRKTLLAQLDRHLTGGRR